MTRGLGLRDLQGVVKVAHADLATLKEADDAQARRIGQRFQDAIERGQASFHICLDKYIRPPIVCLHLLTHI